MATNSVTWTGAYGQYSRLYIEFNLVSQHTPNNTSTFSYKVRGQSTDVNAGISWYSGSLQLSNAYSKTKAIGSGSFNYTTEFVFDSGTFTVSHNADGTLSARTLTAYVTLSSGHNATVSVSLSVPDIKRASQPSLNVSTQALGSAITISTNRASTSFTHTLTYDFGNQSGTIATGVGDSQAWTLPIGLASAIPNAPSGTGTITCKTFNGSTEIGTKSVSFIATVPNNATFQPTATIGSIVQGTTLPSGITVFVQNQSKAKVTSTGTGKYGATIKTYSVAVADIGTKTGSVITSDTLKNSGSVRVTLTVTDSRGLKGSTYQDITVVEYSPPQLPVFNASRSESTPVNILANFDGSISPINNQNNKYFRIRSKVSDGSWVKETEASETYVLSGTQTIVSDPDKSYTIEFFVQDSFTSITQTVQVGTAFTLLDFNASGQGMAIGKVSEIEDELEVAMSATFMNGITSDGGGNLSPATTAYEYTNGILVDICPATLRNMVIVDVIGNGYLPDIPIHSIFQVYHYEPFGTFLTAKQTNISGELLAGKFLIDEGRLKLWFQQSGAFQTLIVRAYVHGGKPVKVSVSNVAEPSVTHKVTCALTRGWNSANSNVMTGSGGNGNGRYVRFSDGTQICWLAKTQSLTFTKANNNPVTGYEPYLADYTWTFPASFSTAEYQVSGATSTIMAGYPGAIARPKGWMQTGRATTSCLVSFEHWWDYSGSNYMSLMAIGRWK